MIDAPAHPVDQHTFINDLSDQPGNCLRRKRFERKQIILVNNVDLPGRNVATLALKTGRWLVLCITPLAAARTKILEQMTQQHIDYILSKNPMNRFLNAEENAAMACLLASSNSFIQS